METRSLISVRGNTSHRAPEVINGIAGYRQNPDHSSTLCCDKQPSFELGCILFELAMCGKHPLPGYPDDYGPSRKVTFLFESEELFPMKPPQFPKEFCDLVRSLLQCDPDKRMPLLDAFEVLLNIESPSPSELLSFYSCVIPLTNDAVTLTSKATCQILCGSSTEDSVDTLHQALDVDPVFSPALLLLHYLSFCNQHTTDSRHQQAVEVASLRGKTASFTATDVEFTRAIINKKHRNTLPELVLTALWTRHISGDTESFHNTALLLLKKSPTTIAAIQQEPVTPASIFMRNVIYTRNEMMMEALLELQVGNIDSALALVANAFSLFESEMIINTSDHDYYYLPGLLFLVCVRYVINDHVSLHQHIPTCLWLAFSRALSFSPEEMRMHCMHVLNETNNKEEYIVSEWADLVSTASLRFNIHHQQSSSTTSSAEQSLSCMYFLAVWSMFCYSSSTDNHQEGSSAGHLLAEIMAQAAASPCSVPSGKPIAITCSVGPIDWGSSSVTSLGLCHEFGVGGVDKDIHKAVPLYQRAADAGDARAMCNHAVCFYKGNGVEKDVHKAVTLSLRAADAGNATAMCNLGVCFYKGNGVEKDIHKAVTLYQRAADVGNARAMTGLGCCYFKGKGVEKDISKAVTLIQRAADAGYPAAMNSIAWRYFKGSDGIGKDIDKAIGLWHRAADLGDARAIGQLQALRLGLCW
ncbi:SEL1 protein [Pelomyxa schiedti]|nr:SEL1 protein [Pelomyxa schiedti]